MIPRIFHRWWSDTGTRPPFDFRPEIEALHRDWKIIDHPARLHADWLEERNQFVQPSDQARHASNLLRYRILLEQGGVWLDWDIEPLRPLGLLLDRARLASVGPNHPEGGVMIFPAGHAYLTALLATMPRPRPPGTAPEVSGAAHLRRTLPRHQGFVTLEPRLYGRDRDGRWLYTGQPYVRHHWATSGGQVPTTATGSF